MLGKLFGKEKEVKQAPQVNPQETLTKLNGEVERISKRIRMVEARRDDLKKEALEKNKAGDKRAALMAIKKMKMSEKELQKLDGQSIMIEQQKMMIEQTHFD